MTFLTERKRLILSALHAGGQRTHDLSLRLGLRDWMVREDLRDMRSEQLVRLNIEAGAVWELTSRGRLQVVQDQQLKLRGISA